MPPSRARWIVVSSTALILAFGYVYAQQPAPQTQPQTAAPNPYLMGTEGVDPLAGVHTGKRVRLVTKCVRLVTDVLVTFFSQGERLHPIFSGL